MNNLTGYMMTKYLAFDEAEKAQLACAFPQQTLLESHPNGVSDSRMLWSICCWL